MSSGRDRSRTFLGFASGPDRRRSTSLRNRVTTEVDFDTCSPTVANTAAGQCRVEDAGLLCPARGRRLRRGCGVLRRSTPPRRPGPQPPRSRTLRCRLTTSASRSGTTSRPGARPNSAGLTHSGAREPLRGGGGPVAVFGEASANLSNRDLQREQFAADELVVVVGADWMPVDTVGCDGDLGNE